MPPFICTRWQFALLVPGQLLRPSFVLNHSLCEFLFLQSLGTLNSGVNQRLLMLSHYEVCHCSSIQMMSFSFSSKGFMLMYHVAFFRNMQKQQWESYPSCSRFDYQDSPPHILKILERKFNTSEMLRSQSNMYTGESYLKYTITHWC